MKKEHLNILIAIFKTISTIAEIIVLFIFAYSLLTGTKLSFQIN